MRATTCTHQRGAVAQLASSPKCSSLEQIPDKSESIPNLVVVAPHPRHDVLLQQGVDFLVHLRLDRVGHVPIQLLPGTINGLCAGNLGMAFASAAFFS